ncbi:TGL5 [[Candida] subhashii]|uniref:TGL5 n=1 Tax=[Candida] subhashii TaxID=561895 RepID=A0A8J5QIY5_9ASCO|nr:TGL5 [[Candida] subhashii]KAG7662938.1 TGL5 [[Candida] subhashii]
MSDSLALIPLQPRPLQLNEIVPALFEQYHEIKPQVKQPNGNYNWIKSFPIINRFFGGRNEKSLLIRHLLEQQELATSYQTWLEISLKLDELMGNNTWKSDPRSELYDFELVYNNLQEMRKARLSGDYKLLLYLVRTKWVRNLGNMGDSHLYRHSYVGTKKLIEEYIQECKVSLDYLLNNKEVDLDDRYLLGMLIQTRKNIGRTALVLSGGSTFGVFHIGVLATLFENNVLPRIISGSSAGSIMASILCSYSHEATLEILANFPRDKWDIFEVEDKEDIANLPTFKQLLHYLGHFIKYGTLFDIVGLQRTMANYLGDLTFREAYNRTGKILNISVSPGTIHEQSKLLNYLTAPNCLIWSAVCASCSLPGIFPSCIVYEKNPKTNEIHEWNNDVSTKYTDGSVENDLPIARLSEMFNVDHIVAVQVNPHVVSVMRISVNNIGGDVEGEFHHKLKHGLTNVYDFVSSEIVHYLQMLGELDVGKELMSKVIAVLSQSYSGDITIMHKYKMLDLLNLFKNPNEEFLLDFFCRGAKAAWPKVSIIHNNCGVEFALDKAISLLRGRIITSTNNRISYSIHSEVHKSLSMHKGLPKSVSFHKRIPPGIKRHNSASGSIGSKRNISAILRTKGYPISSKGQLNISVSSEGTGTSSPKRKMISSSSYSQLSNKIHDDASTLVNDENDSDENHQQPSRQQLLTKAQKDATEARLKVRKAKSSGNFRFNIDSYLNSQQEKNTAAFKKFKNDRVPLDAKSNPYLDDESSMYSVKNVAGLPAMHVRGNSTSSLRSGDLATVEILEPESSAFKEKANLPSRSRSNSHQNSYIGLNRLKNERSSSNLRQYSDSTTAGVVGDDDTYSLNWAALEKSMADKLGELHIDGHDEDLFEIPNVTWQQDDVDEQDLADALDDENFENAVTEEEEDEEEESSSLNADEDNHHQPREYVGKVEEDEGYHNDDDTLEEEIAPHADLGHSDSIESEEPVNQYYGSVFS